jgi:hypothetical protein
MGKTVAISDDMHTLVSKKKTELFEKYKISVRIVDLVNKAIKYGVDKAYEEFVPQGETQKLELIKKEDMT